QYSSTRSQQSTKNRGKAIVTSSAPTYDLEPAMALALIIRGQLMLLGLGKIQEEVGVQLNAEKADWKDDTDDVSNDQELEAHYMYMAQIQEVTPDPVDNFGPIFDDEPMHKVQNNNDNYNVFAMENEHSEQPESSNHIYLAEQGDTKITIDSLDICYNRDQVTTHSGKEAETS
ncbi:hypothetical protein Tco_0234498, partial [Tanacetum coccineum]